MMPYVELIILLVGLLGFFNDSLFLKFVIVIWWNICCMKTTPMTVIFFLVGILISTVVVKIEYTLSKRHFMQKRNKIRFPAVDVINAVFEEILWRDIIIYYFNAQFNDARGILVVLFYSVLFVAMHKPNDNKAYIEMTMYTLMIFGGALFFPGMHYGLHAGRNIYIGLMEDQDA